MLAQSAWISVKRRVHQVRVITEQEEAAKQPTPFRKYFLSIRREIVGYRFRIKKLIDGGVVGLVIGTVGCVLT